jgi:hypothetical protein
MARKIVIEGAAGPMPRPKPGAGCVDRPMDQLSATSHLYTHLINHGVMALNLKNAEVEGLAAEVARLTGESEDRGHPARI